jgi:hypothetical protein
LKYGEAAINTTAVNIQLQETWQAATGKPFANTESK